MPHPASTCMRLTDVGLPLVLTEREVPAPGPGQVWLRVRACGVCRTDLHVVDGELPDTKLPIVPGHEIVGEVLECGAGVSLPTPRAGTFRHALALHA